MIAARRVRGRIAAPVKYWKTALSIFALSASLALAEDFRTTKGKEYKNATVSRVEPDGIVIKFRGGIVKLPFTELPSDVQMKYEYDPVAAREYAAQRDRVIPRPTATPDANLRTSDEADDAQSSVKALNPAEQWVVAQATAGEIADLSKQFPDEDDRQLSAHFLEDLLMGTLPDVKLHRHGVQIEGACIDEPIDLAHAQIPCAVGLDHCQFNKTVTFAGANFAANASFQDSTFNAEADFNSVKVGHSAFLEKAVFEGRVDFVSADIASNFEADGAKFQNKEEEALFNAMKVGNTAFFRKAVFEGPVDFVTAGIANSLVANEAQFKNTEKRAIFNSMKVGHTAFFSDAVFEGPVDFGSADIANSLFANEAQFKNTKEEAIFNGMKVGQAAFFDDTVFEGPVDFGSADIASNFEADRAKFQNKEKGADFRGMKVRGRAFFRDAVFEGPVNFSDADFAWLDLSSSFWPKVAAQFHMGGMSYKYIRAVLGRNEPESHKALLKLANQSSYTADVYSNLEEFFLRQGCRADADKTFIAGKRRERKENLHGLGWLGSWLLDWLVGYGRRPWQAGIPCAVLVALGCVLFSPTKMEPQKPEDVARVYSRFWYSLGLFLPFVDLQADKVWKPKADQTFLRNYMRVHIMLGWILVPLVLAALTGLIK